MWQSLSSKQFPFNSQLYHPQNVTLVFLIQNESQCSSPHFDVLSYSSSGIENKDGGHTALKTTSWKYYTAIWLICQNLVTRPHFPRCLSIVKGNQAFPIWVVTKENSANAYQEHSAVSMPNNQRTTQPLLCVFVYYSMKRLDQEISKMPCKSLLFIYFYEKKKYIQSTHGKYQV